MKRIECINQLNQSYYHGFTRCYINEVSHYYMWVDGRIEVDNSWERGIWKNHKTSFLSNFKLEFIYE